MDIYDVLALLNIKYEEAFHEKVYTIEEANRINISIAGAECKNLFLKSKNKYYLLILKDTKRADLKIVKEFINSSNLSFARENELNDIMGLEKGSVTPFGLINDKENLVTVLIDSCLVNNKLFFHPNRNDRTINIDYSDLLRFIEYVKHDYYIIDI